MQVSRIATEIEAIGSADGAAVTDLAAIQAASNNPATAGSPAALMELQLQLADYTKRMIVAAGLANHANKTVETLLKS